MFRVASERSCFEQSSFVCSSNKLTIDRAPLCLLHIWSRSTTCLSQAEPQLSDVYIMRIWESARSIWSNRLEFKAENDVNLAIRPTSSSTHQLSPQTKSPGYYSFESFINLTAVISHRSSTKKSGSFVPKLFNESEGMKDRRDRFIFEWIGLRQECKPDEALLAKEKCDDQKANLPLITARASGMRGRWSKTVINHRGFREKCCKSCDH